MTTRWVVINCLYSILDCDERKGGGSSHFRVDDVSSMGEFNPMKPTHTFAAFVALLVAFVCFWVARLH